MLALKRVVLKKKSLALQLPKLLELVGLGYTAWFVYRYLLFKVRDWLLSASQTCSCRNLHPYNDDVPMHASSLKSHHRLLFLA